MPSWRWRWRIPARSVSSSTGTGTTSSSFATTAWETGIGPKTSASQVFLEAIAHLPSFDGRGQHDSFRAWLYGIARNVTASARRTEQRHPTASFELAGELVDRSDSPEEQALAADELLRLRSLLMQLSSEQQELVELRLAGLTSLEIAHVLGKSHDAVRKAQSRTMAALKAAAASTPGFSNEAHHG